MESSTSQTDSNPLSPLDPVDPFGTFTRCQGPVHKYVPARFNEFVCSDRRSRYATAFRYRHDRVAGPV